MGTSASARPVPKQRGQITCEIRRECAKTAIRCDCSCVVSMTVPFADHISDGELLRRLPRSFIGKPSPFPLRADLGSLTSSRRPGGTSSSGCPRLDTPQKPAYDLGLPLSGLAGPFWNDSGRAGAFPQH